MQINVSMLLFSIVLGLISFPMAMTWISPKKVICNAEKTANGNQSSNIISFAGRMMMGVALFGLILAVIPKSIHVMSQRLDWIILTSDLIVSLAVVHHRMVKAKLMKC